MQTGYQPERVDALDWYVRASIGDLSSIRSTDPVATSAMHAVIQAQQNLENHWLPLVMAIKASDAMLTWTASALHGLGTVAARLDDWLTFDDSSIIPSRFATMSDDDLLSEVEVAGHFNPGADAHGSIADRIVAGAPFWSDEFPLLADELARRVSLDDRFSARLIAAADHYPLTAVAIGHATFPMSFTTAVLPVLLDTPQWWSGVHVEGIENALTHIMQSSPATALEILGDDVMLNALAEARSIDTATLNAFVRTGLYDAVALDRDRLVDGYAVLEKLTVLARTVSDDGFHPGMARGIADSMFGYVDTLARGINFTKGRVYVHVDDGDAVGVLGSRTDVKNLFGTVMRDSVAQATLGVVLGSYTDHVVSSLGSDLGTRTGVEFVARLGVLLRDGLADEQAELELAAAAESARRKQVGKLVGFGIGLWASSKGVSTIGRKALDTVVSRVTDDVSHVDPDHIEDTSFGRLAYQGIILSWLQLAVERPELRADLGGETTTEAEWSAIGDRLDEINGASDEDARQTALHNLENQIKNVPSLDEFWKDIATRGPIHELTHGGPGADD